MDYSLPASSKPSDLNCIDLSSSDIQKSVALLKQACLDSGFFYVVNHGISEDLINRVFEQSKKFFKLPMDEKMMYVRNHNNRGYTPLFDENLDSENRSNGDYNITLVWKCQKMIQKLEGRLLDQMFGLMKIFCLDGEKLWRNIMGRHFGCISSYPPVLGILLRGSLSPHFIFFFLVHRRVAKEVSKVIALALGLEADFFKRQDVLGKPIASLRPLHYEGLLSDPSNGIYGCGAHSDFGFITLLATDDVPGLQICKDKDAKPQVWESVSPMKGAFIVNLGDMLERWSNCVFRSTLHRVIGNGQERYSIAFFVEPNLDCVVECLPTCKSEANPPKFPPISCQDYLCQRYIDTHANLNTYK